MIENDNTGVSTEDAIEIDEELQTIAEKINSVKDLPSDPAEVAELINRMLLLKTLQGELVDKETLALFKATGDLAIKRGNLSAVQQTADNEEELKDQMVKHLFNTGSQRPVVIPAQPGTKQTRLTIEEIPVDIETNFNDGELSTDNVQFEAEDL